ncbi:MAG: alpha/beta hydrolase [Acidimicrobiales bacterium]
MRYGPHRSQVGELWRPDDGRDERPVVVLIHGGFWRAIYTKQLMHHLAQAIADQGWAVWNIEYRRVGPGGGGGGWPATFVDVAAAFDHLGQVGGIDRHRIVACGHSAGGHLALWAAGRPRLPPGSPGENPSVVVHAALSLAGVVDLVEAAQLGLGGGAARNLLGATPEEAPDRYAAASPAALLPLGVPQVLLHGDNDAAVPIAVSEHYQHKAVAAGDDSTLVTLPGVGHMELIEPKGLPWEALGAALNRFRS